MKYFTPAWHAGDVDDEASELVPVQYAEHLERLVGRLPVAIRERLASVTFHDAQVRECTVDYQRRALLLSLVAGDNQSGYVSVDLAYHDVALDRLDVSSLRTVASNAESELLYDEIDAEGEYVIHRLLFWPYQELEICFRSVEVHTAPTPARLPLDRIVRCLAIGSHAI